MQEGAYSLASLGEPNCQLKVLMLWLRLLLARLLGCTMTPLMLAASSNQYSAEVDHHLQQA